MSRLALTLLGFSIVSGCGSGGDGDGDSGSGGAGSLGGGSGGTAQCSALPNDAPVHSSNCMPGTMPSGWGEGPVAPGRYVRHQTWSYAPGCTPEAGIQEVIQVCDSSHWSILGGEFPGGAEAVVSFGEIEVTLEFVAPIQETRVLEYESPYDSFKLFDKKAGWIRFYHPE